MSRLARAREGGLMNADDTYEGLNALGPQDRQLLHIEMYLEPELFRSDEVEVVKQKLGEEAWHQARGLIAASGDDN
jgi:hypothetical protein